MEPLKFKTYLVARKNIDFRGGTFRRTSRILVWPTIKNIVRRIGERIGIYVDQDGFGKNKLTKSPDGEWWIMRQEWVLHFWCWHRPFIRTMRFKNTGQAYCQSIKPISSDSAYVTVEYRFEFSGK